MNETYEKQDDGIEENVTLENRPTYAAASPASSDSSDLSVDGGYGWVCVLCAFVVNFFSLGIESTWGVYQEFYVNGQALGKTSNSDLAWVGALQAVGISIFGFLSGILVERLGYRITAFIGTTLVAVGLITASFATQVWHLYLTQGLIFAIGSALSLLPALTVSSQWFKKRRGLASGISVSGFGIGGLVLSPVTRKLIDALGFRWALRITGILAFTVQGVATIFMKNRVPPSNTQGPAIKVRRASLLTDKVFIALWTFLLLESFGYYVPIFYIPEYAKNHLGRSQEDGATALAIQAGLSAVGRVIAGIIGDKIGHITALAVCQLGAGVFQMVMWPFVTNLPGLMGFAAMFGLFSGGIVSLTPVVAAEMYGLERLASVTGLLLSGTIPGTIAGPSIAGAIIDNHTSASGTIDFLPAQLFGGSWLIGGFVATVMAALTNRVDNTQKRQSGLLASRSSNETKSDEETHT